MRTSLSFAVTLRKEDQVSSWGRRLTNLARDVILRPPPNGVNAIFIIFTLLSPGRTHERVSKTGELDAPPELVMAVITENRKYVGIVPGDDGTCGWRLI